MNKKTIVIIGVVITLILLNIIFIKPKNNFINNSDIIGATKVQVFMFHATQRCSTCIRIGRLLKDTVQERFAEQLKSGKIEFREINVDLQENRVLAEKFQATGSSLFINAIKDGKENIQEDTMVWQLVGGNAVDFKDYLENKLNNILGI